MISENTKHLLIYRYLKGVGKKYLNELVDNSRMMGITVKECFEAHQLRTSRYSNTDIQIAEKKAIEQYQKAQEMGHRIISSLDDVYPESLKKEQASPVILFCNGDITLLNNKVLTIIGTREPTQHGAFIAERITRWFTSENWVIASGLAKGIDTSSHQACLDTQGKTIAILAHGLEKIYPSQNKKLAAQIVKSGGLLITEYEYGAYVGKLNFIERDRIQAAIAKAVLLVQSDLNGGSLHASRAIIEYGKYLIVAGQSNKDIHHQEEKISANMLLAFGQNSEKAKLLNIEEKDLDKLLILKDKESLQKINDTIEQAIITKEEDTTSYNLALF